MKGEVGLKISKIKLTKFNEGSYEMCFYGDNDSFFHIVGDNDLKTLLTDALNNINDYTERLVRLQNDLIGGE